MKVSQVNKILKDNKMQNKDTNFKIVEPKTNTGRLTVAKVYNDLQQLHQEVVELKSIVIDFIQEQRKVNEEQRKFNQLVIQRLDNLVKKNNLKE